MPGGWLRVIRIVKGETPDQKEKSEKEEHRLWRRTDRETKVLFCV